jgi:hydroxymethylpyrimidine/phosphomethylpyrimidine kinase
MSVPAVATVGTTHPLGFAGLTFAVLALAADGVRPVAVVTGVSAQDAAHVTARVPVDPDAIAAQFEALRAAGVAAFHVGALLDAAAVRAVAAGLDAYPGVPVVVDPVLAASGGDALADPAARAALCELLIARATLITPNLSEAGALLGTRVDDVEAMTAAARALVADGAAAALVKGGHLAGDAIDVFADATTSRAYASPRIERTLRGTGDLLAATIASSLARGFPLPHAVERARTRVRTALASGVAFAGTRAAALPLSGV